MRQTGSQIRRKTTSPPVSQLRLSAVRGVGLPFDMEGRNANIYGQFGGAFSELEDPQMVARSIIVPAAPHRLNQAHQLSCYVTY
jgi:hypothetical protein